MSKSLSPAWPSQARWGLPLILFVLALGIRLIGIGWGLPNNVHQESYHPDESIIWISSQQVEPAKFSFTPGFYNYGTLYLTTLKIASDMTAAYTGGYDPKNPDTAWSYMARCHLAGRWLSALAGAGMALMVFLILRRFSSDVGAMFGGLLIALAPAHVVHSRFQTVDILAAFLLSVSAYFALKFLPSKLEEVKVTSDVKLAVLAGLFAGLSAGTKYTGILCLFTLYVAVFMARRPSAIKLSLIGTGAALAAFFLVTPGAILDNAKFMQDFVYEMKHTSAGHGLIFEGTTSGFLYHLSNLFFGIGFILTLAAMAGLGAGAFRKHAWALALLAFFIPYYLLIGRAEVKFIRYTFPLYLALGVGFGWLMGKAREKEGKWHIVVAAGILGLGGLEMGGLRGTALFTGWMASPDPRELAGKYLSGLDTTVGVVTDPWFYTPSIHPELGRRLIARPDIPFPVKTGYEPLDPLTMAMTKPKIERYAPLDELGQRDLAHRTDWDIRLLENDKPEYVVISSFEGEGLDRLSRQSNLSPAAETMVKQSKEFMERLKTNYVIDRQFGPGGDELVHDMMYVQPTVWVWKRKATTG